MLPVIVLVRHGETEWSAAGRHTGRTDVPLTSRGERDAALLQTRLRGRTGLPTFTSPLQRASRTAELTGFAHAEVDGDLIEWHYGEYEGLTTAAIRVQRPDWQLFRDGCPGGESAADVGRRADRVIAKLRAPGAEAVLFSSGHFLRVLAARWLGLDPGGGRLFILGTAAVCELGYDHDLDEPCIRLWNDTAHLRTDTPPEGR
jgi:broad specificity phosphatase PhoE